MAGKGAGSCAGGACASRGCCLPDVARSHPVARCGPRHVAVWKLHMLSIRHKPARMMAKADAEREGEAGACLSYTPLAPTPSDRGSATPFRQSPVFLRPSCPSRSLPDI